jgi:hypothetical protein
MNRVLFSSASVEWPTPKAVYEQLDAEFHFTFDPCPIDGSAGDGVAPLFRSSWEGERIYANPPYNRAISAWLERAGEADIAVFLLPARTDTRWFHRYVLPKATEIRFLPGRLKFGDAKNCAPFPSLIAIFDNVKNHLTYTGI